MKHKNTIFLIFITITTFIVVFASMYQTEALLLSNNGRVVNQANQNLSTGDQLLELRISTFNIHGGRDSDNVPSIESQADQIRSSKADVVMLQEAHYNTASSGYQNQVEQLAALSGLPYYVFGRTRDFEGGHQGNAILSRFPLENARAYLVPQPAWWWLPWNRTQDRGLVLASIDFNGRAHFIISTHYSNTSTDYQREHTHFILNTIKLDFIHWLDNKGMAG